MAVPEAEQTQRFFYDEQVRWLIAKAREHRALAVTYPREIHISNLFAWLFSPNEGHGLHDLAIKELLMQAWNFADRADPFSKFLKRFTPARVSGASFSNAIALREFTTTRSSDRIDLVIIDHTHKLLIGIENKFGARQGPAQLQRYSKTLDAEMKRANAREWTLLKVLLDYDPESIPEQSAWVKLNYDWAVKLIRTQIGLDMLPPHSAATLQQFADYLEDDFVSPYPGLDSEEAETKIEQVLKSHHVVFRKMAGHRSLKADASVIELLKGQRDAIATEYFRHRRLWDYVLNQNKRLSLTGPVQKQIEDMVVDKTTRQQVTFFCREAWLSSMGLKSDAETYWPIMISVHDRKRTRSPGYTVRIRVDLSATPDVYRTGLREWAMEFRRKHYPDGRNVKRTTDDFVLANFSTSDERTASAKVLALAKVLDESFLKASFHLGPQSNSTDLAGD